MLNKNFMIKDRLLGFMSILAFGIVLSACPSSDNKNNPQPPMPRIQVGELDGQWALYKVVDSNGIGHSFEPFIFFIFNQNIGFQSDARWNKFLFQKATIRDGIVSNFNFLYKKNIEEEEISSFHLDNGELVGKSESQLYLQDKSYHKNTYFFKKIATHYYSIESNEDFVSFLNAYSAYYEYSAPPIYELALLYDENGNVVDIDSSSSKDHFNSFKFLHIVENDSFKGFNKYRVFRISEDISSKLSMYQAYFNGMDKSLSLQDCIASKSEGSLNFQGTSDRSHFRFKANGVPEIPNGWTMLYIPTNASNHDFRVFSDDISQYIRDNT